MKVVAATYLIYYSMDCSTKGLYTCTPRPGYRSSWIIFTSRTVTCRSSGRRCTIRAALFLVLAGIILLAFVLAIVVIYMFQCQSGDTIIIE